MADLLEECISSVDPKRKDYKAFQETFCVRCRNVECDHAQGYKDKFARRTSQQFERMFSVPQANPQLPKYANIQDFPNMIRRAMQQEIVDRKGDWEVPEVPILDGRPESAPSQTNDAVDRAAQSLASSRGRDLQLPDYDELEEENPDPVEEKPVEKPKPAPTAPPRPGNTPAPQGGIVIGSGPTPKKGRKPDPWAPPKPIGKVVEPGATIQLGSTEESDENDK